MFHEVRFPADISYGATGGPCYSTDVVTMPSKGEQRNQNWANARCKYNATHGVKTQEQLDRLIAFFRNRKGKATGFRYKDWSDFKADTQLCAATPVAGVYQLQKSYMDDGGFITIRKITKPVAQTVKVYGDTKLLAEHTDYTLDYATGLITVPVLQPSVLTATFEFDVPVRFDTDDMPASIDTFYTYSWAGIQLIEIAG